MYKSAFEKKLFCITYKIRALRVFYSKYKYSL